ncbi:MAG: hypothetical protein CMN28_01090 [Salinisphaeraceae bacterium]|nr:hypothetical protein [Salinisphaeraceae bacterium]
MTERSITVLLCMNAVFEARPAMTGEQCLAGCRNPEVLGVSAGLLRLVIVAGPEKNAAWIRTDF